MASYYDIDQIDAALSNRLPFFDAQTSGYVTFSDEGGMGALAGSRAMIGNAAGQVAAAKPKYDNAKAVLRSVGSSVASMAAQAADRRAFEGVLSELRDLQADFNELVDPRKFEPVPGGPVDVGRFNINSLESSVGGPSDRISSAAQSLVVEARQILAEAKAQQQAREQDEYARKQYEATVASERESKEKADLRAQEIEERRFALEQQRLERQAAIEDQRAQASIQAEQARLNAELAMQQQQQAMQYASEQSRLQAELAASRPQQYYYGAPQVYVDAYGVPTASPAYFQPQAERDPYVDPPFVPDQPALYQPMAYAQPSFEGESWVPDGGGIFGMRGLGATLIEAVLGPAGGPTVQKAVEANAPAGFFAPTNVTKAAGPGGIRFSPENTRVTIMKPDTDWTGIAKTLTDTFNAVAPSAFSLAESLTGRKFTPPGQQAPPQPSGPGLVEVLAPVAVVGGLAYAAYRLIGAKKRGRGRRR